MSGGDKDRPLVSSFHKFICNLVRDELHEFAADPVAFIERERQVESRHRNDEWSVNCMENYTDGMRQTVVADLRRLKVTDSVLLAAAQEGDLDTVLMCVKGMQSSGADEATLTSGVDDDEAVEVSDEVTDAAADLDEPDLRLASNVAYMIPLITAWQKQLGRQAEG